MIKNTNWVMDLLPCVTPNLLDRQTDFALKGKISGRWPTPNVLNFGACQQR